MSRKLSFNVFLEGGTRRLTFFNSGDMSLTLASLGFQYAGEESGQWLLDVLKGLPKYTGLIGPMYDGRGFIRYEDAETYAKNSQD